MTSEEGGAPAPVLSRKKRILERLQELGAEPKRSLGQNFLISDHVVNRILFAVKSEPFSGMIEVGPGLGALTEDLLSLEQPLVLLELDEKFIQYWSGRAQAELGRLRVAPGDALQLDWKSLGLSSNTLFVSNLPYQISSSLVIERCLEAAGVTRMVLMFQKEVAQRLMAKPRTKEYGLLTVIAQSFWEISAVCDASPQDFFPPPNVSSRVLMFRRKKTDWLAGAAPKPPSSQEFLRFVKAAFSHRRKLMSRNLQQEYFGGNPGILAQLGPVFEAHGLTVTARAEELDPGAFIRLYLSLRSEGRNG